MLLLDLVGYFFDQRLGTSPWFLLAGYAFGLCVVFHAVTTAGRRRRRDGMNDRATNDG
jgi:F0F1-type ATP synthase assembly protein I